MKNRYKQMVEIDGEQLEAIWYHATGEDEWQGWYLISVDGWEESMCPEQIWAQAEEQHDYSKMSDADERDDFDDFLSEERIW